MKFSFENFISLKIVFLEVPLISNTLNIEIPWVETHGYDIIVPMGLIVFQQHRYIKFNNFNFDYDTHVIFHIAILCKKVFFYINLFN
jgi:hypothetical protein